MLKCIKIILTEVGSEVEWFYRALKKSIDFDDLEGLVAPAENGGVRLVINGPKELVDSFVDVVDEIVLKHNIKKKTNIGLFVEPFFKDEDYRGLFRFIKKKK